MSRTRSGWAIVGGPREGAVLLEVRLLLTSTIGPAGGR